VGIYWLASYPKSGNTWLRAFLTNYLSNSEKPADINELDGSWAATARETFDDYVGIDSSSLSRRQINYYRPLVYSQMSADYAGPLFFKIHDAFTRNAQGQPLFPACGTAGGVYLIRNPLDVAVSYAHHQAKEIDRIVEEMGRDDTMLAGSTQGGTQLPQRLLSWSGHVKSWVDTPEFQILVLRYEDMLQRPEAAFESVVRFAGFEVDMARLRRAVDFSSFDSLRAQEFERGFREKQPRAKSFFREGRTGAWRESLSKVQVDRLVAANREMMLRFGYLSPKNELLV
jgi:Sulfotransferase domain